MRYIYQLHMAIQWKWMWDGNAVVSVQVNFNFVLMFRTDQFHSLDALKAWGATLPRNETFTYYDQDQFWRTKLKFNSCWK